MGIYGFSSSDDDAEYTPPVEDGDQDKDGDRYVRVHATTHRSRFLN